jgi:hypothetical protein
MPRSLCSSADELMRQANKWEPRLMNEFHSDFSFI